MLPSNLLSVISNERVAWRLQGAMATLAAKPMSRRVLNSLYTGLNRRQRAAFYSGFAKVFRNRQVAVTAGTWTIEFCGKAVKLPITKERAWLDWDTAVSILGHESDIKETYADFIIHRPPAMFIDVGGNYGTHSLLFLVHGINTLTFEPNRSCYSYFDELCALNGVTPRLETVALGAERSEVELVFPERATWSGSIKDSRKLRLQSESGLKRIRVLMSTLDAYIDQIPRDRALIKIDIEGGEYDALIGAGQVLKEKRPILIFESLEGEVRAPLFRLFAEHGYNVSYLPLRSGTTARPLSGVEFEGTPAENFAALPQ